MIEVAIVGAGRHAGEVELDGEAQRRLTRAILQHVANFQRVAAAGQTDFLGDAHALSGGLAVALQVEAQFAAHAIQAMLP